MSRTIRFLPTLALLAVAASIPASAVAPTNDGVVAWISAASHPLTMTDPNAPLDDLAALSTIVGRAEVVGLGEATPGSHEIWTLKHRMVQYLVRRLGFTAFVMETTASIGRELDDYVLNDVGDPRTILSSFPWSCPEVVDVFLWMRTYNAERRHQWKLRVAGMDLGLTPEDVDQVTGDVAIAAPDLLPLIRQAYAELRAAPRVSPVDRTVYSALPPATKAQYAAKAQQVVDLLQKREAVVVGSSTGAFARALQGARLIRQVTHWMELLGTDPGAALAYHEQAMAENAGWWHDQVGKTVIWAHDAHVAKRAMAREPDSGKMMGSFLRARFADRYLSIGTSFGQGVYLAIQRTPGGEVTNQLMSVSLGPPSPTTRNAVLDQAGRDYLLDLRPAPAPVRAWLLESEPFEFVSAPALDDPKRPAANAYGSGPLGEWFDVLAHLRRVNAARDPTALAPAHRPVGQVLHTSVGDVRELRFAEEFRYAGGQRFILKKAADAEQHFFVAADRGGTVRRVYWIQFESLLPGIGRGYDYSTDAAVTVYGVPFRRNTVRWEAPPAPDSDRAAMFRFLAGRGYRIPDGAMRLRLVHVPDSNPREELMVVYVEVPEPGVAPPAEADVQRRAVEGLQVGAR